MNRQIKGIWIPIEVWELRVNGKPLGPTYTCILAEIDSLSKKGRPCTARNSHFVKIFGVSTPTVTRSIAYLHQHKLIRMYYNESNKRCMYANFSDTQPNQIDDPNQNEVANQNDEPNHQIDEGVNQNDEGSNQIDYHRIHIDNNKNTLSSIYVNKNKKSKKIDLVSFENSDVYEVAAFKAIFSGSDYEAVNLEYYHERVKVWASDGKKRKNWVSVAKMFMLNDRKDGKLMLNQNVKANDESITDIEEARQFAKNRRRK